MFEQEETEATEKIKIEIATKNTKRYEERKSR
jgi:hypothetical protein